MKEKYPLTYKFLQSLGNKIVLELRNNLQAAKKADGDLYRSSRYVINEVPGGLDLGFILQDYWEYVDAGRRPGKQPPLKDIQKWVKRKGIDDKWAYPIARKIGLEGIPPTFFFTKAMANNKQILIEGLAKMVAKDSANNIRQEIKDSIKNNK